jgi:hypothetical protein
VIPKRHAKATAFAALTALAACGRFLELPGATLEEPPEASAAIDASEVADAAPPQPLLDSAPDVDAGRIGCPGCVLLAQGMPGAIDVACGSPILVVTKTGSIYEVADGGAVARAAIAGAVDSIARNGNLLYLSLPAAGQVVTFDLGGSNGYELLQSGLSAPRGLDLYGSTLYIASATGLIRTTTTAGAARQLLVPGAAVDVNVGGSTSVAIAHASAIELYDFDGGPTGPNIENQPGVMNVSFTEPNVATDIVWSRADGTIWVRGNPPRLLADGQTGISGLCRFGVNSVYFVRSEGTIYQMSL